MLSSAFDQEAAAVLMARLAVLRLEQDDVVDVMRWLDRKLIRLAGRFGNYTRHQPESFHLGQEFALFPAFMFHLRRSQFIQTFNASPDESAYYRVVMMRENVANTMLMVQPALMEYSLQDSQPRPTLLDAKSLRADVVLLLDSFFHIVIWYGTTVDNWREQKYHEQDEYAHLRALIEMPVQDSKAIIAERFPVPKFIMCKQGGSQARFLLAKVNPSVSHTSVQDQFSGPDPGVVITDDVSLATFMDHLIKLVVESEGN
eukprot:Trichotokara_eunicae@DN1409_c0_g1_i1.p1